MVGSLFASVAFLDAAINELYVDATDPSNATHKWGIDDRLREQLALFWPIVERMPVLVRYSAALNLGSKPLNKGNYINGDTALLIDLRNVRFTQFRKQLRPGQTIQKPT